MRTSDLWWSRLIKNKFKVHAPVLEFATLSRTLSIFWRHVRSITSTVNFSLLFFRFFFFFNCFRRHFSRHVSPRSKLKGDKSVMYIIAQTFCSSLCGAKNTSITIVQLAINFFVCYPEIMKNNICLVTSTVTEWTWLAKQNE